MSSTEVLKVGSRAPELVGAQWLQGSPVHEFSPDHLYVVEFWSTWCEPCRATIPKLSRIAADFEGKVTVVGVDVFEEAQGTRDSIEKVEAFVAKMGSKMTYRVLIDNADGFMANQWMKRSGRQGIPSAFVVDGSGKIAWIGHPAEGLERVLAQILDGSYVPQDKPDQNEMQERMAKAQIELAPFLNALKAQDFAAAMREADLLVANNPEYEASADMFRFQAAATCQETAFVREMLTAAMNDPTRKEILGSYGHVLAHSPGLPTDIYLDAIKISQANIINLDEVNKPYKSVFLDALASLYFNSGDVNRAIETELEAIAECNSRGEEGERYLPMCEAKLESYQEALEASA